MFHIWRRVQRPCDDLLAGKQVCCLTVRFIEGEIATWSTKGIPHRTMGVLAWDKRPENCDIGHILELLIRMKNIAEVRIILPIFLQGQKALTR